MYALADMFFLESLKLLSKTKLQEKLDKLQTCDHLPECVREIYASTHEGDYKMRSIIVQAAVSRRGELDEIDEFKDLLREGGQFVVDYVKALVGISD